MRYVGEESGLCVCCFFFQLDIMKGFRFSNPSHFFSLTSLNKRTLLRFNHRYIRSGYFVDFVEKHGVCEGNANLAAKQLQNNNISLSEGGRAAFDLNDAYRIIYV